MTMPGSSSAWTRVGVSFVVPVHDGAQWIRATLASIVAQSDGRPFEIIVVDDRSRDGSGQLLRQLAMTWPLRVVEGEGHGAAAAINTGIRLARYPIVCQVDQDVVLSDGWMRRLVDEFADPAVAAVQGQYVGDPKMSVWARVMALDLAQRYAAMPGRDTEHVCTGNSAYRAIALHQVGLFDERLGYGYDNDMSYRLRDAGYRLIFCREATSVHHWRNGFRGYCVQQYGFGYGRIDLVAKHPRRIGGDSVSPASMMAHPLVMAVGLAVLAAAAGAAVAGLPWQPLVVFAVALAAALTGERAIAAVQAAIRFGDRAALAFPIVHLVRDVVWAAAIAIWCARRILRQPPAPAHSMPGRASVSGGRSGRIPADEAVGTSAPVAAPPVRTLCLIPAHNEAANLPAVIGDVRTVCPWLDILVVDDGSTDATAATAERLGVRWIRFPQRMGIGSAIRAGLRYAMRLGCDAAIRIDGDGQHRASDIARVLDPVVHGRADVVFGSRYTASDEPFGIVRLLQRTLAASLSTLTGKRITDATSGFCALGPRAIRLLAEHHPTGYGEAELQLFMSCNALNVVEIPIRGRRRLSGRTSLTPVRLAAAGARILLAMLVVPLRVPIRGNGR